MGETLGRDFFIRSKNVWCFTEMLAVWPSLRVLLEQLGRLAGPGYFLNCRLTVECWYLRRQKRYQCLLAG